MPVRHPSRRDFFGSGLLRRGGWLALFSLLWSAPILRADIQDTTGAHAKGAKLQRREKPASGVTDNVSIDQGGTVEITLRARGQVGKWVDFLIRTQPAHGSLAGEPRQITRDSAEITYVHRAEDGPGTDAFTYSVQAAGSAVSAPTTVTIEIRDTAPALVANPAELDFGAVKVGDSSGADLVLQNEGGGEAVGKLFLPPPWMVDGAPDYRLRRGERQSFHILFVPGVGRSFSETIPLVTDAGAPVHLLGTGLGQPGQPSQADPVVSSGVARRTNDSAASVASSADLAMAEAAVTAAANSSAAAAAPPPAAPPRLVRAGQGASADPMRAMQPAADDTASTQTPSVPLDSAGYITLYDTGVKQIKLRRAGRTTLDISWKPMVPAPKSYRVELRYLALDAQGKLRIDWRPYAQADIHVEQDLCTAVVRGLPPQTRQTLRVVALDFSARVQGASATLQASTLPEPNFWRVTPLRVLVALLLLCLGLAIRRRWEERQILREIDESRAARTASSNYTYRV
jgi:hypothetical protein